MKIVAVFRGLSRRHRRAFAVMAAGAIVMPLIALALAKELPHDHFFPHHMAHEETHPATPAGIEAGEFSSDGIELSGWAPAGAAVHIVEHGKDVAEEDAGPTGIWDLSFAAGNPRTVHVFAVSWQQGDTTSLLGQLFSFAPDPSPDDATLWWQEKDTGNPHILQSPDASEDSDLFLTLMQVREGQSPVLAGHASPRSLVQLYADSELAGAAIADAEGYWILSSVIGNDKKAALLRLDEIYKGAVRERRAYRLSWAEKSSGNDQPGLLQTNSDSWIVAAPADNGHMQIAILKSDAGAAMPPDKPIPGQVLPVGEGEK